MHLKQMMKFSPCFDSIQHLSQRDEASVSDVMAQVAARNKVFDVLRAPKSRCVVVVFLVRYACLIFYPCAELRVVHGVVVVRCEHSCHSCHS